MTAALASNTEGTLPIPSACVVRETDMVPEERGLGASQFEAIVPPGAARRTKT